MTGAIEHMVWRQLVRRPVSVSVWASPSSPLSRPSMRRQTTTSLLRKLPSSFCTSSSPTVWQRTSRLSNASSFLRRSYSSKSQTPPPPRPPKHAASAPVRFWPFFLVIALSSGSYMLLVNQRADMPAIEAPKTKGQLGAPSKPTPAFSPKDVVVIFVLGGPGAGKGTQCANLVRDYGFTHLSAGDLLRAEQDRPGSQFGSLIQECIRNGEIVPMEVTIQLLENAMREVINKQSSDSKKPPKFLIDGFPRKMDQAIRFEETVCPARFVLFFDCPQDEMERRLLNRGKTSGRADDNEQSIRKRFKTFIETSMPVVDYYEKQGRVIKIDATRPPEKVYEETKKKLEERLGDVL